MRHRWNHVHGITNVWTRPPLHDGERMKGSMRRSTPRVYKPTRASTTHLNQKPLELVVVVAEDATTDADLEFAGLT